MYKFETHTHTAECDLYAELSGAELVRAYHDIGYSGLMVTDHYFGAFYSWFADELDGLGHREIIKRYLKGYYAAREEGERIGFTVLPGAEVRLDGQANDYLIYGLEEEDFYSLPLLNRLGNIEELRQVLPEHALIIQAHPYREGMTACPPEKIFGIEGYNGGTEPIRNEMAMAYGKCYDKAITSGSDCHGLGAVGKGGLVTERPILTPKDLTHILREREYAIIETK